jgi:hypothetical protein
MALTPPTPAVMSVLHVIGFLADRGKGPACEMSAMGRSWLTVSDAQWIKINRSINLIVKAGSDFSLKHRFVASALGRN